MRDPIKGEDILFSQLRLLDIPRKLRSVISIDNVRVNHLFPYLRSTHTTPSFIFTDVPLLCSVSLQWTQLIFGGGMETRRLSVNYWPNCIKYRKFKSDHSFRIRQQRWYARHGHNPCLDRNTTSNRKVFAIYPPNGLVVV